MAIAHYRLTCSQKPATEQAKDPSPGSRGANSTTAKVLTMPSAALSPASTPLLSCPDGHITFDLEQLSFLHGEAPDTVNPSLWRQAQLNAQHHGL